MAPEIRRATEDDAAALGDLHSFCWTELYGKVLPAPVLQQLNPGMMADLWAKFTTRGEQFQQWVAIVNDEIVGFTGIGPSREPSDVGTELYFLYVAPALRKSGIGGELLRTADPDFMWVWEKLKPTMKFYADKGYHQEVVHAVRGKGNRTRANSLFGTYLTEFRFTR
jgi:GNAT superfamily N-acetyltransferase